MSLADHSPASTCFDNGGRSYGRWVSLPTRVSLPSKPSFLRDSAPRRPASEAPTTTMLRRGGSAIRTEGQRPTRPGTTRPVGELPGPTGVPFLHAYINWGPLFVIWPLCDGSGVHGLLRLPVLAVHANRHRIVGEHRPLWTVSHPGHPGSPSGGRRSRPASWGAHFNQATFFSCDYSPGVLTYDNAGSHRHCRTSCFMHRQCHSVQGPGQDSDVAQGVAGVHGSSQSQPTRRRRLARILTTNRQLFLVGGHCLDHRTGCHHSNFYLQHRRPAAPRRSGRHRCNHEG